MYLDPYHNAHKDAHTHHTYYTDTHTHIRTYIHMYNDISSMHNLHGCISGMRYIMGISMYELQPLKATSIKYIDLGEMYGCKYISQHNSKS